MKIALPATAVVLIVALLAGKNKGGAPEFKTATATVGEVETVVMATGYLQPLEKVEVGTQVSGVIEKIYVDFNSHVKKGQLLAQLDVSNLQESVNQAQSNLNSAMSNLNYATLNFERVKTLYEQDAATRAAYEEVINSKNQAETSVANARADLKRARTNLSYASIYSPIDGVILDRAVNIGQTVAASFSTPTLFTIAKDLTKMQVEADVDEADIGQVRVGQNVSFTVDAHHEETFTGTVSQIRLQSTVSANVVTYKVIISAPNPEEKLYPGMTASINIEVDAEKGVMVPIEAINFKMDAAAMKALRIKEGKGNGSGVWVMREGEPPVWQAVSTGGGDGNSIIIRDGLEEGATVITGKAFSRGGGKVKVAVGGGPDGGPGGE